MLVVIGIFRRCRRRLSGATGKLFSVMLIIMAKDIKLKLAWRIRELRKKHNYTQQKLAELTNIDYKHIQLLESKQPCAARIDTIEKLAKAFRMSCAEFLDFD